MEQKMWQAPTGLCNPANEREDGQLIKSSYVTMNELSACQLAKTKVHPKMYFHTF
jgi:hypothetical protein